MAAYFTESILLKFLRFFLYWKTIVLSDLFDNIITYLDGTSRRIILSDMVYDSGHENVKNPIASSILIETWRCPNLVAKGLRKTRITQQYAA